MSALRLTASGLVTLVLLSLCALLAQPTFNLPTMDSRGSLSAGAFPQFVVISIVILTVFVFANDVSTWLRKSVADIENDVATPRQVLRIGAPALLILAAYIFAWRHLNFLVTTVAFFTVLSALLGRPSLTRSGHAVLLFTSVLFCTGTWALFVHVLKVPLR